MYWQKESFRSSSDKDEKRTGACSSLRNGSMDLLQIGRGCNRIIAYGVCFLLSFSD